MAGPSGFVQRFKGKVAFPTGGIWIGGTQVTTSGADLNTQKNWGTVTTSTANTGTVQAGGVTAIAPTSDGIWNLPTPVAGETSVITYSTYNGALLLFLKASTGVVTITGLYSTAIAGSSLTNTIKSTVSCQIELIGLSSVQYLFNGVYPSTDGHLTFSTTT
jgi:hypothetical protein